MSFIQMIEQLGANAALQQLNQAQLMAMFKAETNTNQMEALLKGNIDALTDSSDIPVYHCVLQIATDEDEQPAPKVTEKPQHIHLQ